LQERGNRLLKILDYYAGVPLTFLLGHVVPKTEKIPDLSSKLAPRFTLIKTAAIGDTVLLSAIVREIRVKYPCAVITLICTKSNEAAAALLDGIDAVRLFDLRSPVSALLAFRSLLVQDIVWDFGSWARINCMITFFIKARYKVGFERKGQYRHYIYDKAVSHRDDVHEIDNYRSLLQASGIEISGFNPLISTTGREVEENDQPMVIFHPFPGGSGKKLKEWPLECWLRLGENLAAEGFVICISGGKEDRERAEWLAKKIEQAGGKTIILAGCYSLVKMCDILKQAKILVSVNTGIMHLGAAVGVPIVALNGPTSPLRWGPLGEKVISLVPTSTCAPCLSLGFEYGCATGGCMNTITVEVVKAAVDRLLLDSVNTSLKKPICPP